MQTHDRQTDLKNHQRACPYRARRTDALVDNLTAEHGSSSGAILPVIQGIVAAGESLSRDRLGATADALHVHDAQIAGVASFYSMLPAGRASGAPIRVCDGPTCMLRGATEVNEAIRSTVAGNPDWHVCRTSCLGLCDRAPAALVFNSACGPLSREQVPSLLAGWRGHSPGYSEPLTGEQRVAMERLGKVDPERYASAREAGAYQTLERVLVGSPADAIREVEAAGLRGCGGAGFPTGKKWRMVAEAESAKKYVVCNADESEPGAFKDRVLMEGDPHLLIEGLTIAAYSVGATKAVIYVRGEYERSAQILERAIDEASQAGWLGDKIANSSFSLRVAVHRGAGAYICGEETALLESLEGRRGEPRLRPPYPTTCGLHGLPTVVNNVETLCMVPAIMQRGGEWFRSLGPVGYPGTKVFTLSGHAHQSGAFESPLRITPRRILNDFGQGMRTGSRFKMALTGGAAGTFIPESLLDVPLDYDSVKQGVALGSGVMIVFDNSVSAVDALEWVLRFFRYESCGKCTPCREGTLTVHNIISRLAAGDGRPGDLDELRRCARMLSATSFCGLGKSVDLPITSALNHFAKDFMERGAT